MRRRMPIAALTALVLTAAVLTVPSASPAAAATIAVSESVAIPASGTITISGRGFGHGVGLSQYGARAQAAANRTAAQILDFYYPGTTRPAQDNTALRVLISGDNDNTTQVTGNNMSVSADGAAAVAITPQASAYRAIRDAAGVTLQVLDASGAWVAPTPPVTAATSLTFSNGAADVLSLVPTTAGTSTSYRGVLRAVADGAAPGLKTVNEVPMESYLRSVVPAEMLSSWPAAALQAQAVAARTYAAFERAAAPSGRAWDLCDTTACQVYKGRAGLKAGVATVNESAATDAAISATAGQVVTSGGMPAFTQFSASNGGWTTAGQFPYLPAVADTWDATGNSVSPWSVTVTGAQIKAKYPAVGTPTQLEVLHRNGNGEWGGRVVDARITGTAGTVTVSGTQLASALGLRSSWWRAAPTPTPTPTPQPMAAKITGISGAAVTGVPRTLSTSGWPAGTALTYQWAVAGKVVSGATKATFTIPQSAAGKQVTAAVKGVHAGYVTTTVKTTFTAKNVNSTTQYRAHVQNIGWQPYQNGGTVVGTTGRSLRVEALQFRLVSPPFSGSLVGSAHVENIGWMPEAAPGAIIGTQGRSLRVEAFTLRLTGSMYTHYDIWYRTHAQNLGWLGWTKNGARSGTAGLAYRLEAVQVIVLPKGSAAPGSTTRAFVQG